MKSPPLAAVPPEQSVIFGMMTFSKWLPPSVLTTATRLRAPPFDQRSCWRPPTIFRGFIGLTSTQGSTTLSGKSVPGLGAWKRPFLSSTAPVKPPRTCPKSSLSYSDSVNALQLTERKTLSRR